MILAPVPFASIDQRQWWSLVRREIVLASEQFADASNSGAHIVLFPGSGSSIDGSETCALPH